MRRFVGNDIGVEGAKALAEALKTSHTVHTINLGGVTAPFMDANAKNVAPHKDPIWTIGGKLFFGPEGWTSLRALVGNPLPIYLQFLLFWEVEFYLDVFFFGSRSWASIRAWTKQGGGPLFEGGFIISAPV